MKNTKYQMTCPKCHYEFHYDNDYYDDNIARLGVEIQEIILQLQKHKQLPKNEQYMKTEWWLSAKRALTEKQKQIGELKAFRKVANQQRDNYMYHYFKAAVKEICGEAIFKKCLEKAQEEAEAYTTADIMKTPYSKANYKADVISVSKL